MLRCPKCGSGNIERLVATVSVYGQGEDGSWIYSHSNEDFDDIEFYCGDCAHRWAKAWFCWNPECGWSGDNPNESEPTGYALCPECGQAAQTEAATERAAIREYDGKMTREEAEQCKT